MTKPIDWRGSSLRDLQDFPEDAKHVAGYQLRKLQQGGKDVAKRRYGAVLLERKTK